MPQCECAFGPRCESMYGCADENQTIGIKDRRSGEIRKRADWSVNLFELTGRKFHVNRIKFYCDDCLQIFREISSKPLFGIDRPKHASDLWKPSLADHLRDGIMETNRQQRAEEKKLEAARDPFAAKSQSEERLQRLREMPLAQYKQVLIHREWCRIIAEESRKGRTAR